ncbi:hypothetical protein [Paenibacillus sp. JCM 10914]|uniref:hypothetical protein n=1 Tax=Paenibacillus sp. JCM 10914 TaxID=1236974 RepID=UPI0005649DC7|nr:hypothetical protein [Paenibacillus sp. JCM 10914]
MKRRQGIALTVVLTAMIIGGCSNPEAAPSELEGGSNSIQGLQLSHAQSAEERGTEMQRNEGTDEEKQADSSEPNTTAQEQDDVAASLKGMSILGKTMAQVQDQLGTADAFSRAASFTTWQYDYVSGNYEYNEQVVSVDVTGLYNGQMAAQLMVTFNESQTVDSYTVYYADEDGEIIEYRLSADGVTEGSAKD